MLLPIHILEDKVVVLKELMTAYKKFAIVKQKFEVFAHLTKQSRKQQHFLQMKIFWGRFRTMPWLALPSNDVWKQSALPRLYFVSGSRVGHSTLGHGY